MTLYTYPITVEREGRQYYAYSDDFTGVYGLGKSIEEAKKSILKAMRLYIAHCRKARKQVPAPRTVYSETVRIAME
jgi:predicted RNase H-like HicB family nuclease